MTLDVHGTLEEHPAQFGVWDMKTGKQGLKSAPGEKLQANHESQDLSRTDRPSEWYKILLLGEAKVFGVVRQLHHILW